MDIREATGVDRRAVVALLTAQFEEHGIETPQAELEAAVTGVEADPARGTFLLAVSPAGAIGLAYLSYCWTLEHGGRVAWLEELYVAPAHRGRGIGSALLERALDVARARACRAVDLEVARERIRAARLYDRRGFVALDRQRMSLSL